MESIQIFHADRHQLFRDGLRTGLKNYPVEIVGEADNVRDMMNGLAVSKPDLLIVSHLLCDGEATEYLPKVKKKFPDLKILMLTMMCGQEAVLRYFDWLEGMIGKWVESDEIWNAIITIVKEKKLYFNLSILACQPTN